MPAAWRPPSLVERRDHLGQDPQVADRAYALVAEPDSTRAVLYRQVVEEEGFAVVITRDGQAALAELASRGAPALLVANLSLARTDGFALLAALRRRSP